MLPIPNGCFFPIFIVGAASGRLYAEVAHALIGYDSDQLPAAVVSVVGAAALAAGTTQTLSTALICLEFTRQQQLLIPVLLAGIGRAIIGGCYAADLVSCRKHPSAQYQLLTYPHLNPMMHSEI